MFAKKNALIVGVILLILLLDQSLKIWVKTHMLYGEMIPILGWDRALLHFVENDGMAFGKRFNIPHGKLILSLFRILAATFLIVFLRNLLKTPEVPKGVLLSFAFILAGAIGNIIDCTFYGMIFSDSFAHGLPAVFLPPEGGYSSFLHGKVIDMFYFPLMEFQLPDWLPFWAGESLVFFGPVFNLADVAISWGVLQVLFFHRSFFQQPVPKPVAEAKNTLKTEETNEPDASSVMNQNPQ